MTAVKRPIVLATNLSEHAGHAARWARDTAAALKTTVVVAHAVDLDMGQPLVAALDLTLAPTAIAEIKEAAAAWYAAETGARPDQVDARIGHVASTLCTIAEYHGAEMLVLARSDKGRLARMVAGSRVQQIASRPPCPLVVVHEDHDSGEGPIAVGTDYSEANRAALDFACRLAHLLDRRVDLLHSVDLPMLPILGTVDETTAERVVAWTSSANDHLSEQMRLAHPGVDVRPRLLNGDTAVQLAEYAAREHPAVVVVGQTGHGLKISDLLGSVPRKLLNQGKATVVVVPPGE